MEKMFSVVSRVFFFVAFGLLGLALFEAVANVFNYTVLRGAYSKGRVVEFAAVLLVFVVTLLLRQIREALKHRGGG